MVDRNADFTPTRLTIDPAWALDMNRGTKANCAEAAMMVDRRDIAHILISWLFISFETTDDDELL